MAKLKDALELHELGWRVVAAPLAGKSPVGSWKKAQTEPATEDELQSAFASDRNIFLITGSISRLAVLDCDEQVAIDYWHKRLGDILDETACVTTSRGKHYYFRLPEGEIRKGRSSPGGDSGTWDLRAEGGGVVAPPSVHPSGRMYRWAPKRGPEAIKDAPAELWTGSEEKSEKGPSSLLSHLLANPPAEGGRNNWLARVAGHLAVELKHRDAYEESVRGYGNQVGLEEEEIEKLIRSIWTSEQAKSGKAPPPEAPEGEGGEWRIAKPSEESGWLMSGDTRILTQIMERDDEGDRSLALAPWLNADVHSLGVFDMEDGTRVYHVEVRTEDGRTLESDISNKVLGDSKQLVTWLHSFGVSLASPDGIFPRGMTSGARMCRYLEAQKAPVQQAVDALGWHEETASFLTHEGLLKPDGFHPFETVRPAPRVEDWAPYSYGLNGGDFEAAETLREVLTFHDERVCAVFGSWWAACLLKPQISAVFSQFPFMALEAPSESGKSTGFFPLMLELSGNRQGKGNPTRAALRDYLSAHRNGIVWVDDLDSLDSISELIRGATVEGSVIKKALNQTDQVAVQLHAALSISGEALGIRGQKALLDRSIGLEVPSPVGRQSLRGEYPQYQDIVELKAKQPDLTDFAGTLVVKALSMSDSIPKLALELRVGSGRLMDKLTIMRIGARILRELAGGGSEWVEEKTEEWIQEQIAGYDSDDNSLTMAIIPAALSRLGMLSTPYGPDPARKQVATPVFVKEDQVWFAPSLLAAWWSDLNYGRIDQRTASQEALAQQAKAIGAGGRKGVGRRFVKYATGGGGMNYWRLPDDLSRRVIERAKEE